eukprot:1557056-Ditylum_brightwellii.AAC.1
MGTEVEIPVGSFKIVFSDESDLEVLEVAAISRCPDYWRSCCFTPPPPPNLSLFGEGAVFSLSYIHCPVLMPTPGILFITPENLGQNWDLY